MNWTNKIQVYNDDCMNIMQQYEDGHFDLAIVDPPYGIDWMGQIQNPNQKANWKKYKNKDWDKNTPNIEYFEELKRVSKHQIIWGGNYFLNNLHSTNCVLIWDKMQEFSGAVFEMAWTSFKSPSKAFRMSRIEAYEKGKIHPTQKPVKLYRWLLDKYAKPDFKILDTHLGSGSNAIACHWFGCELVAAELDEEYYNASLKRFKSITAQQKMF